jgi:hypothetical protein
LEPLRAADAAFREAPVHRRADHTGAVVPFAERAAHRQANIDRSDTIGRSDCTTVDSADFSSRGSPSPAGLIVIRWRGSIVFSLTITSPVDSRKRNVTCAGASCDCSRG